MGHTEREREMLSLSYKALGLETLSRKTRGQKAAKQSLPHTCFVPSERERVGETRDERRERDTHTDTHTHTHTQRESF
jgi:hypothetical protein